MKYAFNNNGVLQDVIQTLPSIVFPKSYASQFIEVSDTAISGWLWDGTTATPQPPPAFELAGAIKTALLKIDADTDSIYGAILGNRAEEYTSASDDAAAYKAAGYTGTVPPGVQSWATAKSWTAQHAADDILATTTAWVTAQNAIRATRLARKEQIRAATDAAGISTVMTAWAGFVVYMRGQLGL